MTRCTRWIRSLLSFACLPFTLLCDVGRCLCLCLCPSPALAAENLFLRKQLALYPERQTKPRRTTNAIRMFLVWLSRLFASRQALVCVQPATRIRWHRQSFYRLWRWQSRPGRPPIPAELQALIRQMAQDNPTWRQECIANELLRKLGLRVSPQTVRKYMPKRLHHGRGICVPSQRWLTFVRNQVQAIVACDFCAAVTAHPTAEWTLQQLRDAISSDHDYRFLIRDRDSIFSKQLDQRIRNLELRVLKTPPALPGPTRSVRAYLVRYGASAWTS